MTERHDDDILVTGWYDDGQGRKRLRQGTLPLLIYDPHQVTTAFIIVFHSNYLSSIWSSHLQFHFSISINIIFFLVDSWKIILESFSYFFDGIRKLTDRVAGVVRSDRSPWAAPVYFIIIIIITIILLTIMLIILIIITIIIIIIKSQPAISVDLIGNFWSLKRLL